MESEVSTNYFLFNFSYFHHQAAVIDKNRGPTTLILQGNLFLLISKISYPRKPRYTKTGILPLLQWSTHRGETLSFLSWLPGIAEVIDQIDPAKTSCFPPFLCYTEHWRDRDILSQLIRFRNSPRWFSPSTFSASLLTSPFVHHGISSRSDCHVYFLRQAFASSDKIGMVTHFIFYLVYVFRHSNGSYGIPYTLDKVEIWNRRTDGPYAFL